MPALRHALSITQKLNAMYSDPAQYARARSIADKRAVPGTSAHSREITYFLVDAEAMLHTSREATGRHLADRAAWRMRRDLCLETTGEDLLLTAAPKMKSVDAWRDGVLPTPVPWQKPDGTGEWTLPERKARLAEAYGNGLPEPLIDLRHVQQVGALALVNQMRRSEPSPPGDLSRLSSDEICSADGTWVRGFSDVEQYDAYATDPETGEEHLAVRYAGSRAASDRTRRVSVFQHSGKSHGPAQGVNHVAILTRTPYGRVLLTLERAMGGEVHAALDAYARIHAIAPGRFRAICYDKAMAPSWQTDYLTAKFGLIPISPSTAASTVSSDERSGAELAMDILRRADAAANPEAHAKREAAKARRQPKKGVPQNATHAKPSGQARSSKRFTDNVKLAATVHVLSYLYADVIEAMVQDAKHGLPVGRGLPLGKSASLGWDGALRLVESKSRHLVTQRHQIDGRECEHQLHLDDGAVWRTNLGARGEDIKTVRLTYTTALELSARTGWYEVLYTLRDVCEENGDVLTYKVRQCPKGELNPANPKKRKVVDDVRLVAPCDPAWRHIYGLRNDCESWFSWLKDQFPQHRRAPSLDLNHQMLDLLNAAALSNSITRFHYLREAHL